MSFSANMTQRGKMIFDLRLNTTNGLIKIQNYATLDYIRVFNIEAK